MAAGSGERFIDERLAPKLVDGFNLQQTPMPAMKDFTDHDYIKEEEPIVLWHLSAEAAEEKKEEDRTL